MLKSPVPSACPHRACPWAPDHLGGPSLDVLQFLLIPCSTHLDNSVLTWVPEGCGTPCWKPCKTQSRCHPSLSPCPPNQPQKTIRLVKYPKEEWRSIWYNLEQHQGRSHLTVWKDPSGLFCMWAFLQTDVGVGFLGIFFRDITVQKSRCPEQLAEVK